MSRFDLIAERYNASPSAMRRFKRDLFAGAFFAALVGLGLGLVVGLWLTSSAGIGTMFVVAGVAIGVLTRRLRRRLEASDH